MRRVFTLALLLSLILPMSGQESFIFQKKVIDESSRNIDYALSGSHVLGVEMAKKVYLFKQIYTYIELGSPLSPADKMIVRKPAIFYSVRKLDKYYRKMLKKGEINKVDAYNRLSSILDISCIIFDQNTNDFEAYLRNYKKPEDVEKAFGLVVLN